MSTPRLRPEVRKEQILAAALTVAGRTHYAHMTRDGVAKEAGVTGPLVHHYFRNMALLRRNVLRVAIEESCYGVIAQALVANDPYVLKAPLHVRIAALSACGPRLSAELVEE